MDGIWFPDVNLPSDDVSHVDIQTEPIGSVSLQSDLGFIDKQIQVDIAKNSCEVESSTTGTFARV